MPERRKGPSILPPPRERKNGVQQPARLTEGNVQSGCAALSPRDVLSNGLQSGGGAARDFFALLLKLPVFRAQAGDQLRTRARGRSPREGRSGSYWHRHRAEIGKLIERKPMARGSITGEEPRGSENKRSGANRGHIAGAARLPAQKGENLFIFHERDLHRPPGTKRMSARGLPAIFQTR
jgi:hypothetical protein